jgi:hypothetical protein
VRESTLLTKLMGINTAKFLGSIMDQTARTVANKTIEGVKVAVET